MGAMQQLPVVHAGHPHQLLLAASPMLLAYNLSHAVGLVGCGSGHGYGGVYWLAAQRNGAFPSHKALRVLQPSALLLNQNMSRQLPLKPLPHPYNSGHRQMQQC